MPYAKEDRMDFDNIVHVVVFQRVFSPNYTPIPPAPPIEGTMYAEILFNNVVDACRLKLWSPRLSSWDSELITNHTVLISHAS